MSSWDKKANYAQLKEEEKMLLVAHVEMNETRRQDVWFLDSGCSNHMCGDKTLFCDLNKSFRQMVKLGNNTRMAILGKPNVRLKVNSDIHVVTKVFYVPELKNNLLNIGQLQEREKGMIIQTEMTANQMFVLIAMLLPQKPACFHTTTQDLAHLWHCKYGHLGHKELRTLQYKKMVHGIPQFKAPTGV